AFVDEYRAVSIAVIGNADRISTVDNRAGELLRRRGSGVQIDVATIRLASDAAHLEAKLLEEPRRDGGRGAISAVDDQTRTVERFDVGQNRPQMREIFSAVVDLFDVSCLARRKIPRRVRDNRLDVLLQLLGELFAVPREHLDAVVLERVV